ncbi:MAG TPA: LuxR C-terminal-related transcriptional regulator, partial [Thermoanaerobaculia bacterium]
ETFSTALRAYRVCEYAFLGLTEMRLLICRLVRAAIASPGYIRRRYGFTEQEARVAFHLAHGRGNQAIGRELGLTERTVRHHVERIMRKLNSGSRTEAAYRIWCGSSR